MVHFKDIYRKERKLYKKYSWWIYIILGKNAKYSSPKAFTILTLALHALNFVSYKGLKACWEIMLFCKIILLTVVKENGIQQEFLQDWKPKIV